MKCLTILQPWASAIVGWNGQPGPKRIENRSWNTNHRGELIIHAGKGERYRGCEDEIRGCPRFNDLPRGVILGVAQLVHCVRLEIVIGQPFAEGPWCWILENVRRLAEPIPYKGEQGLFDVPDDIVQQFKFHSNLTISQVID